MAKTKEEKTTGKFGRSEDFLSSLIYDQWVKAERDDDLELAEFDSVIDMLECKRTEKDYEWMSDVFIPEYPSIHLTEASQWANQYFQTREFVDVFLEGSTPDIIAKTQAVKKCINGQLNVKSLNHYIKYMRARGINSTRGFIVAVCNWRQNIKTIPERVVSEKQTGVDYRTGAPTFSKVMETVPKQVILEDRFDYDVCDPRNVKMSSEYAYSIQDKEWVIIRSEVSYDWLKDNEVNNSYFNLDIVKKFSDQEETDTSKKTREVKPDRRFKQKYFDAIERYGKCWAVVTERDELLYPTQATPGYNEKGDIKQNAELVDCISTIVYVGSKKVLIRFQPMPWRSSKGMPYRNLVRGLCYIHPTKDVGMSDGKYGKELQVAINDTVNQSNDRVKLATLPTLKMRKNSWEDNESVYFEPEHPIIVEDMGDLEEFKITDNIQGSMAQAQLFIGKLQQLQAVFPSTMGELPELASTTATAVAGSESRANIRANYKSLTFEYTFLNDFYWMILQMTYRYMQEETALKLMGPEAAVFDPDADYTYQPVTSNIEVEYNKNQKIKNLDQMLGRISNIPNPAIIPLVAQLIGLQLMLMGQEPATFAPLVRQLMMTPNTPESGATNGNQPANMVEPPTSNQSGMPMSDMEMQTRERMM